MPATGTCRSLSRGSSGLRVDELWALHRRGVNFLHKELTVRYAPKEINSEAASTADNKGLLVGPPKSGAADVRSIPAEPIPLLAARLSRPGPTPQRLCSRSRRR